MLGLKCWFNVGCTNFRFLLAGFSGVAVGDITVAGLGVANPGESRDCTLFNKPSCFFAPFLPSLVAGFLLPDFCVAGFIM